MNMLLVCENFVNVVVRSANDVRFTFLFLFLVGEYGMDGNERSNHQDGDDSNYGSKDLFHGVIINDDVARTGFEPVRPFRSKDFRTTIVFTTKSPHL